MAWTDEKFEMAKKLASEGLSSTEIASRINARYPLSAPISRSAVLGKLFRHGVDKRVTRRTSVNQRPRKTNTKKPFRLFHQMGLIDIRAPRKIPVDGYIPPADEPAPLHQRKTLLELEENHCRWPLGDPLQLGFHFCGAEPVPGLPYCCVHSAKAYVTPVRKEQKEYVVSTPAFETEDA